jgi:Erv1 / Alr family
MTIGIAEHKGGLNFREINQAVRVFAPVDAADILSEYMTHFFPCKECSRHFLSQYADCNVNRRCDRLSEVASQSTDEDWKELALWMWEFHNDVNVRLLHEKAHKERLAKQKSSFNAEYGPGAVADPDAIKALWPNLNSCVKCFRDDGSWNDDAVFMFLEKSYW